MDAFPYGKVNASFDPFNQDFAILMPDGITLFNATMADIYLVQRSSVNQAIAEGIQIGAAVLLLVILLLITKKEKLFSLVFVMNALALLFVVLRGILSLCVVTGPLYNFYRYELSYYQGIGNARAISVAGEVMSCLLTIAIEISLVLQVNIVCCNLEAWKRRAINIITVLTAFATSGIRIALMVINVDWNIVHVATISQEEFSIINRFASAANITFVVSICISAIIFCSKLWFAIRVRHSLGKKQFGAMQIIFVMGCQTMISPSNVLLVIFMMIVYFGLGHGQITSFVLTVVAISLPLSAMWATVNTNNARIGIPRANPRSIPVGNPNLDDGKSTIVTNSTLVDDGSEKGLSGTRKWSVPRFGGGNGDDIEMGRLTDGRDVGGVQVDRTYTVT